MLSNNVKDNGDWCSIVKVEVKTNNNNGFRLYGKGFIYQISSYSAELSGICNGVVRKCDFAFHE